MKARAADKNDLIADVKQLTEDGLGAGGDEADRAPSELDVLLADQLGKRR